MRKLVEISLKGATVIGMRTLLALAMIMAVATANEFADYWYAGKAEVAVYELEQSRYGEMRPGTAALIFVTEPFSKSKHVKLDNPKNAGDDSATVLKLNVSKKYNTGIYPYSVMSSAFMDVKSGQLYKATTSIQEWCGHVFSQANYNGKNGYHYKGFSYFQYAGDEELDLKKTSLSEEIMLKIRLNKISPETKKMTLVPTQEMVRNLHLEPKALTATLDWTEEGGMRTVKISYKGAKNLETTITYDRDFPYTIRSWSESFQGRQGRETTSAKLKTVQSLPYWSMNGTEHDGVRKEIGLE